MRPRAAFRADLAPAQHTKEDLQEHHSNRQPDPAQALDADARGEIKQVDLAQREIQQRRRDQYLDGRKQDSAHLARACRV
jgi:hypothetical protein